MSRVSRQQLDRLRWSLSGRDLATLRDLRSWKLLRVSQIIRLHFHDHASAESGARVARRVLARLTDAGLVRRLERRIGGVRAGSSGHVYALTPLGHRLLGEPTRKRWHEPGLAFVEHTLAVSEIGSLAVRASLDAGLEVLAADPEPVAWRTFSEHGFPATLKPDLYLHLANALIERSWFIEVDRNTESRNVIWAKNQTYTRYWQTGTEQTEHGVFPRVLWITSDQTRADAITSTFDRSGVEPRLFLSATTEQALGLLIPPQTKEDHQHHNHERRPS